MVNKKKKLKFYKSKCQNCQVNKAEPLHTCPFAEEVNFDRETLCNCCDSCQNKCADDI